MRYWIGYLLILVFFITSCSDSIEVKQPHFKVSTINARLIDYVKTRTDKTSWNQSDQIGLYVTSSLSDYSNVPFTFSSGRTFTNHDVPIIFDTEDELLSFCAYYPYKPNDELVYIDHFPSIPINTLHQTNSAQENYNIFYAYKNETTFENPEMNLKFYRVLSKVVLNLRPSGGVTLDNLTSSTTKIRLNDLFHNGFFYANRGSVEIPEDAVRRSGVIVDATPIVRDNTVTYTLYLIPQEMRNGALPLDFEINGSHFYADLPVTYMEQELNSAMLSGVEYDYDLSFNGKTVSVEMIDMDPWYYYENRDFSPSEQVPLDYDMNMGERNEED